jgi:predicted  nucleic acid-binding Zn-ribbon protein
LSEHERFEELASLAALGELSPEEHEEFLRHKQSCSRCREVVAETSSVAAVAFLAGWPGDEDPSVENERHRRVREGVAQRLPVVVPMLRSRSQRWVVAAGVAAAFVLGIGLGTVVAGHKDRAVSSPVASTNSTARTVIERPTEVVSTQSDAAHFQALAADLQRQIDQARSENRALRDKFSASDQHTAELDSRLEVAVQQSKSQAHELEQAHNDLTAARNEVSQAREVVSSHEATIDSLRDKLSDRDARLTDVSASLDREREMLSAGREVRDIMGARDLHIVDVIDRDGKGRPRKAFGRAFYTQGKSLIFYAFDLPAKNTTDGKFVYAAWGSNSNKLTDQVPHSLGIFYNDDQTQHRWAMKFDNPKVLEEIDTVFVTLEPAGRPFSAPTGKPVLEAYFGTPPNHP